MRGYRFNVDALLVADFALNSARRPRGRAPLVCDLGAGSGIVGLVILRALPGSRVTAVELQPRLAEIARRNLWHNALSDRGEVVELDLASPQSKRRLVGARYDWVVSNPPYQAIGRGMTNPDAEMAIARHELRLPLARLCEETRRILKPAGQAALIYPAARSAELIGATSAVGLAPVRMRSLHPRVGAPATRVLMLCEKGAPTGRLEIMAPFYEHELGGAPTSELRRVGGDS